MEENKNKQIILAIIGGLFLLILVIGATYAYFQIISNNNTSISTITGNSELIGQATLTTNISSLKLNITAEMMHKDKAGTIYYATEDGVPVTTATEGSGIYTLATASLTESDVPLFCSYAYDISATTSKKISDNSYKNIRLKITDSSNAVTIYSLYQLMDGIIYYGTINDLTYNIDKTIKIEAFVINTSRAQNDLSGNNITIKITPRSGKAGFNCDLPVNYEKEAKGKEFAQFLANNNERIAYLWNSGLEGDGYRYIGTSKNYCSYNNYVGVRTSEEDCSKTTGSMESNEILSLDPDGQMISSFTPNNYVCFGTSNLSDCKSNEGMYMYRIIGVFPDSNNKYYLKLEKSLSGDSIQWHSDDSSDTSWENSYLYSYLNIGLVSSGIYADEWLNKIENWTWSAVNTKSGDGGPNYENLITREIYLHEMNRNGKNSTLGEWTTPSGKIGLMYLSDFALSLGNTNAIINDYLGRSWIPPSGWLISRNYYENTNHVYFVFSWGEANDDDFTLYEMSANVAFPSINIVFYLTSDVTYSSGTGTYDDPFIIG